MSSSCLRLAALRGAFGFVIEVKNTFLDDWVDAESTACRRACRRAFRSTPASIGSFEADADASFLTRRGKSVFDSDLVGPQPKTVSASAVDATVAVVDEKCSVYQQLSELVTANPTREIQTSQTSLLLSKSRHDESTANVQNGVEDLKNTFSQSVTIHEDGQSKSGRIASDRCWGEFAEIQTIAIENQTESASTHCGLETGCRLRTDAESFLRSGAAELRASVMAGIETRESIDMSRGSCNFRVCHAGAQESLASSQSSVFEITKRCEQDACDIGSTDEILSMTWEQVDCTASVSRSRDCELAPQRRRCRGSRQLRCCFFLDSCMTVTGFHLNKKVIGKEGCSTKAIYETTGVKVRLRGIGSGHIEPCGREAREPLMLSLSTARSERENFRRAIEMAVSHLSTIEQRYREFCIQQKRRLPSGRRFWIGDTSGNVESLLKDVCDVFSQHSSASIRLLDRNSIDAAEEIKD